MPVRTVNTLYGGHKLSCMEPENDDERSCEHHADAGRCRP
jgi:hypothetical protein